MEVRRAESSDVLLLMASMDPSSKYNSTRGWRRIRLSTQVSPRAEPVDSIKPKHILLILPLAT